MNDSKNMWGGRFTSAANEKFVEFNRSFGFDRRLFSADLFGSAAYADALRRAGILTNAEAAEIKNGLQTLFDQSTTDGDFFADSDAEDVHSFIEEKLTDLIGATGGKLHTGRSRNDQTATALRIWLRAAIDETAKILAQTQTALLDLAEKNETVILPGYTHLQRAQPILLAHWCLAYFEMLRRDTERFAEIRRRTNVLPLGSGALAGNSYGIDREEMARDLGFESVSRNSLDAVSDRDFAAEFLAACALVAVHLSRFAEDAILYATTEFGFFELSDAIATGSSLMPQKKNPDSLELIRGKTGRIFGNLTALLTVLKGLPTAYNKDLQEDKETVFDSFDTIRDCLEVTTIVLQNITVNREKTRAAAMQGYLNATELADYLVKKGIAFRTAHEIVGKIVVRAIELDCELNEMELPEMQRFSDQIQPDVFQILSLKSTLSAKNAVGGTAPDTVAAALREARQNLL